jgi:hypothetical protein
MIGVRALANRVEVTIPTEGLSPEEINDLVSWLRVESIVSRSKLSEEDAWQISEEIKSSWWESNKDRFIPPEPK